MARLVVCIMGQNADKFLPMCLDSVKDADAIVYLDGGSKSLEYLHNNNFSDIKNKVFWEHSILDRRIIHNHYKQDDPTMNGKQRNFYLNYLKESFVNQYRTEDWWCLALDADEVVEDLSKIKEFITRAPDGIYSVKMRHFIGDLGHEDATKNEHFVPNRLFKISEADFYTETEHSVLQPKKYEEWKSPAMKENDYNLMCFEDGKRFNIGAYKGTTIWHLAYIPNMWAIKKRYENHMKKSQMHTPEFLDSWYKAHLFGSYPKNQINLTDIPEVILKEFNINKDEFYFQNRVIELKHSIMTHQWNDYFKPESVLDLGCGRGCYLYFWQWYTEAEGIELSNYAVKNAFCPFIIRGDISNEKVYKSFDLITAIDVLEHLDDEQLDKTLKNMVNYGKRFLFSIPFIGDPNLELDKTHKQFRTKENWKELIKSHGIEVEDALTDWLFSNQLLIGKRKENI